MNRSWPGIQLSTSVGLQAASCIARIILFYLVLVQNIECIWILLMLIDDSCNTLDVRAHLMHALVHTVVLIATIATLAHDSMEPIQTTTEATNSTAILAALTSESNLSVSNLVL